MERTLALSLNKFASIPTTLSRSANVAADEININLANLYHHYYLDTYGTVPPDPDPAHFEYARFLCPDKEFRLAGEGLGVKCQQVVPVRGGPGSWCFEVEACMRSVEVVLMQP